MDLQFIWLWGGASFSNVDTRWGYNTVFMYCNIWNKKGKISLSFDMEFPDFPGSTLSFWYNFSCISLMHLFPEHRFRNYSPTSYLLCSFMWTHTVISWINCGLSGSISILPFWSLSTIRCILLIYLWQTHSGLGTDHMMKANFPWSIHHRTEIHCFNFYKIFSLPLLQTPLGPLKTGFRKEESPTYPDNA